MHVTMHLDHIYTNFPTYSLQNKDNLHPVTSPGTSFSLISPFLIKEPLSSISASCYNVYWFCWLDSAQVLSDIHSYDEYVQGPCLVQQTVFQSTLLILWVLHSFIYSSALFSETGCEEEVDKVVQFSAEHSIDTLFRSLP